MANPLAHAEAVTGSLMLSSARPTMSRSTNDGLSDAVRWALRRHSHLINVHDYTVTTLFTHMEVIFTVSSSRSMIQAGLLIFVLKKISQHCCIRMLKRSLTFPQRKKRIKHAETLWKLMIMCVYFALHYISALFFTANERFSECLSPLGR